MHTESQASRRLQIAAQNDRFRHSLGFLPLGVPGQTVMTRGIAALPAETIAQIFRRVATFNEFTPANDPHGEHDCAIIRRPGEENVIFKFDYYADATCTEGAEDARE